MCEDFARHLCGPTLPAAGRSSQTIFRASGPGQAAPQAAKQHLRCLLLEAPWRRRYAL